MTTMADSLVNSAMRPVRVRRRPDLESRRHKYGGKSYWVVKEPVGLNYFRFHEEEFAILNMLDGTTSLQEMKDRFQAQYAPQRITVQELQHFIGMLHRSGLVISHAPGQGKSLRRRADTKKKKEWLGKMANIFALRFRGIDPERLLNRLLPWFGWLFTPGALMGALMLWLAALTLVLVNFNLFRSKLPTFEQFFAADNWLWLGATMAVVKVLHEFGHGLSCKKFGGECHEMGFMLLVFTPALYCNVSDSWMLPNKWQRIFVGAAGMYVELILASIATFLWWFSEPGLFNFLCLSVVFICSVSTLMFNGNPLLRFDGYYILMDLLEIPNLRQKSTEVLKRWFQQYCLGMELQENPFLPRRNRFWFGLFTVASAIYRWVVVISIVLFLNAVLKPYGLQILGRLFAITGLGGLIAQPLWSTIKFFQTPGRISKMKRGRVITSAVVAAAAAAFFAFFPFPFHIDCAVDIEPADPHQVRVMVPGNLVQLHKKPGDRVDAGEVIAQLDNIAIRAEEAKAVGELEVARKQLEFAERTARRYTDSGVDVPTQAALVQAKEKSLLKIRERIAQMTIRSQIAGTIIEPPKKDQPPQAANGDQLPGWTGSPFSEINRDAFFMESDLLCLVCANNAMDAILVIDQGDIDLIRGGEEVEMLPESARLRSLKGTIALENISKAEMKESPAHLAAQAGGALETKMDASGKMMPVSVSYQARVPLEEHNLTLRSGYRGQAKIHLAWKSLGWRLARVIMKTFHFEF